MFYAFCVSIVGCNIPLNRHGAYGYESAKAQYAPFDRLQDPAPTTHAHLARVITGTCGAGQNAYMTINNKAEGSAPLSVEELARLMTKGMLRKRLL